jgi:hypothetical protein
VQSNSTISGLSFDSETMVLKFKVKGINGTMGYTRIMISKNLIDDGTKIDLSIDDVSITYELSATETAWILMFTYHHSSHDVVASLANSGNNGAAADTVNLMIIGIGAVAVLFVVSMSIIVWRKRGKIRTH